MYRPYRVTRQERACFQLIGDKADAKVKAHQQMTEQERDNYWTRAIARELEQQRRATA